MATTNANNVASHVGSSNIGWSLWAVAASLPWLLPTHTAPWTTVYQELLIAATALGAGYWTLLSRRPWYIDSLALGFFAAALLPFAQTAAGMFTIPSESLLVSLYPAGFALTLLVARHAETIAPGRLIDALFASLGIAALLSTGAALYQWLGSDTLGVLVAPIPFRDRPVANVGQPNNLATLLVWGMIATWWAYRRRTIGATGAILAAAFLLIGVTLTQSRAGAVEVVAIAAVAFFARGTLRTTVQWPAFAGLTLWWLVCIFSLDPLTHAWTDQVIRPLLDPNSPRERTMLLKTVFLAIGEHPWIGHGVYQNVPAQVAVADRYAMHGLVANSHNIVLDLVIWCGLPLGFLITVSLCGWYWRTARRAVTSEEVLMLLALGTFCIHASLELPHVFAYFLVPVGVLMGTLSANLPLKRSISVPRTAVAALLVMLAVVFADLFAEYQRVEANLTDSRMRLARIAGARGPWDPHARLLSSLQRWVTTLQVEPRHGMTAAELEGLRRTVTRYPTSLGLLRYAQASAMNDRPADARWALGILCSVHLASECDAAARDWKTLIAEGRPELAAIDVPVAAPLPSR